MRIAAVVIAAALAGPLSIAAAMALTWLITLSHRRRAPAGDRCAPAPARPDACSSDGVRPRSSFEVLP